MYAIQIHWDYWKVVIRTKVKVTIIQKIIRTLKIKNIIGEILKVNRQKAKNLNNITVEKVNKGNGEEGIKNKFSWAEKTLKQGC